MRSRSVLTGRDEDHESLVGKYLDRLRLRFVNNQCATEVEAFRIRRIQMIVRRTCFHFSHFPIDNSDLSPFSWDSLFDDVGLDVFKLNFERCCEKGGWGTGHN